MNPETRPPFPNDDDSSGPIEQRGPSRPISLPGGPPGAPGTDTEGTLADMMRALNINGDSRGLPPDLLREILSVMATWESRQRTGLRPPQELSTAGSATPLTERSSAEAQPPTNVTGPIPNPPLSQTPNPPTHVGNGPDLPLYNLAEMEALRYVHSTERVDVCKLLTEEERRVRLFEKATPPKPTYFPPTDL
jgi:hypothetical protein